MDDIIAARTDDLQGELCGECRKSTPDPWVVAELFRRGAKPLWNYHTGWMCPIASVSTEIFQLFLDAGMTYISEDPNDLPLLHRVISSRIYVGNDVRLMTLINMVLQKFPGKINSVDQDLRTPLYMACLHCEMHTVLFMLLRGADPNLRDINGYLPRDKLHELDRQLFDDYVEAIALR